MQRSRGFTILELAVIGVLVILVIAIFSPMMHTARVHSPRLMNSTQLRGIHQGMVIFAQSNRAGSQEGFYPGLNPDGTHGRIGVEERFEILLDANAFTPEYLINFEDHKKTEYDPTAGLPLTTDNYTYAMLQVPTQGGRHAEWRETINIHAIVLSDRNTGTTASPESIWIDPGDPWRGTVTRNDGSAAFESSHIFDDLQYADVESQQDHLFEPTGADDAHLIHRGN